MNFILEKLLTTSVNHRCNYQNNSNNTLDKQKDKQQTGTNICNSYDRQMLHFSHKEIKVRENLAI